MPGQLKSILQTLGGLIIFNVERTNTLSFGLLFSTAGGVWYGVLKYYDQVKQVEKVNDLPKGDSEKAPEVIVVDSKDLVNAGNHGESE